MTKNIKKVATIAVAMAMLASPAVAGDTKVNWKMAGTLIPAIELGDPSTGGTMTASLLHLKATGSPGAADLIALAQASNPQFLGCVAPVGPGLLLDFDFDDVIATFNDLSQVNMVLVTGTVCVDTANGTSEGEIELRVTGGTGRFEEASGSVFLLTTVVPVSGSLSTVTTTAKGTIHTP